MTAKPVIPRRQAQDDVDDAVADYLAGNASHSAFGFVDTLAKAYTYIGRRPGSGSPRHAHELILPELRVRPLKQYPYLAFYVERATYIDVWRVLHIERDIPAWLRDPDTVRE